MMPGAARLVNRVSAAAFWAVALWLLASVAADVFA